MKRIGEFFPSDGKQEVRNCAEHGEYLSKHVFGKIWGGCSACLEKSYEAEERRLEEERRQERVKAWEKRIGQAGIPERFQNRTLHNFIAENDGQNQALALCSNYAKHFDQVSKRGSCILMCGMPGTGKTHLAVAIGMHVMDQFHKSVLFTTAMRMMRMVKDTYNRDSQKTETQAIAEFVYPDLLILDEVGVQIGSPTEKQIFFDVLNERYEKRKPTIFLSNLDKESVKAFLGERVYDRLLEDGCEYIPFIWGSYRGKA